MTRTVAFQLSKFGSPRVAVRLLCRERMATAHDSKAECERAGVEHKKVEKELKRRQEQLAEALRDEQRRELCAIGSLVEALEERSVRVRLRSAGFEAVLSRKWMNQFRAACISTSVVRLA